MLDRTMLNGIQKIYQMNPPLFGPTFFLRYVQSISAFNKAPQTPLRRAATYARCRYALRTKP